MTKKKSVRRKSRLVSRLRSRLKRRPKAKARRRSRSANPLQAVVAQYLRPLRKAKIPWVSGLLAASFLLVVGLLKMSATPSDFHQNAYQAESERTPAQAAAGETNESAEQTAAVPRPVQSKPVDSGVLTKNFSASANYNMGERIALWTEYLLNSPNLVPVANAFGEAPKNDDTAPFVSGKYDCTTFVETVAALSRSKTAPEFYGNLVAIRYKDGKIGYFTRNHFPEADWIPNNVKAGILKDVTEAIAANAGLDTKVVSKEINRGEWLAKQVKIQKLDRSIASLADSSWMQPTEAKVAYIPIDEVRKAFDKIPNGTIINFVRANDPGHDVLVTHQGFVVKVGKETFLRHVSSGGNIRTVALKDYISRPVNRGSGNWVVVGANFNQLNDSQ